MRQANIRFENDLYAHVNHLAVSEGISVSEFIRNALKFYVAIYERTKGKQTRLFLEGDEPEKEKCEILLPWLL